MHEADCLFCKMTQGEIPTERLIDDDQLFAIRDINPRAPVHVLLIPKQHLPSARAIEPSHGPLLGALFTRANEAARIEGVFEDGFRLAFNVGDAAGMTVHHLHLHLLGGRQLGPEG